MSFSTAEPSSDLPAEEYELSNSGPSTVAANSRPSRRRASTKSARTLTLHSTASNANLLFTAPSGHLPSTRQRRSHGHTRSQSFPDTPDDSTRRSHSHRATFLSEDPLTHIETHEEVDLPDFGHMFGIDNDLEDHFLISSGMRTRWKRKLYLLMEEPSSGREAFVVHVSVTGAIIVSAILTTLSTLPAFHTDAMVTKALFGLDTSIVVLFTIEYIARSLAHSDSWSLYYSWSTSFFGLLDLLAILPYFIEVAQNEDTSILFRFSILRTFRLLRVFRAFKYQNQMLLTIEVMYVAVRRSKDALWALTFFIMLFLVLFSTLIYFAERGTWDPTLSAFVDADGDLSSFDSIPKTAWFSLVTMSTVGYGEVVPKSFLGKMLTVPLLMFGLLLIALPSFVLGRNFAIVYDAMTQQLPKTVSPLSSPRHSLDRPGVLTSPSDDIPLLPTTNATVPLPNVPPSRPTSTSSRPQSVSPLPPVASGGTGGGGGGGRAPRMWEGGPDGIGSAATGPGGAGGQKVEKDLTNVKLAKNQLVLLEQIDSLRQTIESQGQMLSLLSQALGVRASHQNQRDGQAGKGKGKSSKVNEREGEEFALGDSDDEVMAER